MAMAQRVPCEIFHIFKDYFKSKKITLYTVCQRTIHQCPSTLYLPVADTASSNPPTLTRVVLAGAPVSPHWGKLCPGVTRLRLVLMRLQWPGSQRPLPRPSLLAAWARPARPSVNAAVCHGAQMKRGRQDGQEKWLARLSGLMSKMFQSAG